jgi:Raf kinase inhibitor-like YbhB/YbcL family protein
MSLELRSSAFAHEEAIPSKYTCEGADVSVPLEWSGAPDDTVSFALIVDDPDAPDPRNPKTTWVHWVVYDIPEGATELPEDTRTLPGDAREGLNDWDNRAWGGPCPPKGRHRYFFKLYALDTTLDDLTDPTKDELLRAMKGHVLDEAQLMGTYEKKG